MISEKELVNYLGNDVDELKNRVETSDLEELREYDKKTTEEFCLPVVDYLFLAHWLGSESLGELSKTIGLSRQKLTRIFRLRGLPNIKQDEAASRIWKDEEFMERHREGIRKQWRDPEFRNRQGRKNILTLGYVNVSRALSCDYGLVKDIAQRTLQVAEEREARHLCRWRPDEIYTEDPEIVLKIYNKLRGLKISLNGSYINWFIMTENPHYNGPVCYLEGSSGDPHVNQSKVPHPEGNNAFVAEYKPPSFQ